MRPNGEGRAWKGAGVWPPPPFAMAAEREHRLMQTHLTLLCSRGSDHVPPSVRRWLSELPSHADVLLPAGGVLLSWQLLVCFPLWAALVVLALLVALAYHVRPSPPHPPVNGAHCTTLHLARVESGEWRVESRSACPYAASCWLWLAGVRPNTSLVLRML